MTEDPHLALRPYDFVIDRGQGEPEVLEVLCRSEEEALSAAQMFAESAVRVELWQGDRCVWSSAQRAAGAL